MKMINLLHVELILIISRVFTVVCLLCLCTNREYRGNSKQNSNQGKCFEDYDAVTLIMLYLEVLHDMVPKNS